MGSAESVCDGYDELKRETAGKHRKTRDMLGT